MLPKALESLSDSFYRPANRRGFPRVLLFWDRSQPRGRGQCDVRAYSSAVEHYVDIVGVTSSNLVTPTIRSEDGAGNHRPGNGAKQFWRTAPHEEERTMKVRNSLRSLKSRHRDCRIVRRKGRVYVINKTQRRFKARQG